MSIFETELQTKREEHKQALSRLLAEHDKEMETKQSLLSQQQQEVEKEVCSSSYSQCYTISSCLARLL